MNFTTIDSKIEVDKNFLVFKKLKYEPANSYWFHSFVLILCLIIFQIDRAINEHPRAWVIAAIALMWIYPHLKRIFKIVFVNIWGSRIRLSKISEISTVPPENELETTVRIKLKSGREKLIVFRTSENQVDDFVETIEKNKALVTSPSAS